MQDYSKKTYVDFGQHVTMEIGWSEAAMHLQIAGKILEVELRLTVPDKSVCVAQVHKDGAEYSFPITPGEAGFYWDSDGYYYYPPKE